MAGKLHRRHLEKRRDEAISDQFPHLFPQYRPGDFQPVRLPSSQRFGELRRLVQRRLGRERRLERIDHRLDKYGAGCGERLIEDGAAFGGILSTATARAETSVKVIICAQKSALFPGENSGPASGT